MRDQTVELGGVVRMSLLVKRDADKLVRCDVVIEPASDLLSKSLPVAITTAQIR